MASLNLGGVKLIHPLANAVVTVRFTHGFRVRLWLTRWLIWLAVWISGGDLEIKE